MKNLRIILVSALLLTIFTVDVFADVSSAGALFLRIAPGSRAAGMGESFVAIADDATATHWNPAGLGTAPLSATWMNATIPDEFRPMIGMAAMHTGEGSGFLGYDTWLLADKGLVRYDNKGWTSAEVFQTRTDETVESIVKRFLSDASDERIQMAIQKIAKANSEAPFETFEKIRTDVLAAIPEGYADVESLTLALDSLVLKYNLCEIRWEQFTKLQKNVGEGLKDSILTEQEADAIYFGLGNSFGRFIPEELKVPYSTVLSGEPTSIASNGLILLVGTTDGLYHYSGFRWKRIGIESGLPSNNITALSEVGNIFVIGTDSGVVLLAGTTVKELKVTGDSLPSGSVEAVGGRKSKSFFAVVDHKIYHYKDSSWSGSMKYTTVNNDSPQALAQRYSVYDTDEEKAEYLELLRAANSGSELDFSDNTIFEPGKQIKIPFLARLNSPVNLIYVDEANRLWIGTDDGAIIYQAKKMILPSENNPASGKVRTVTSRGSLVYIGTDRGLIEYDNGDWHRSSVGGLGHQDIYQIVTNDDEIWFGSSDKIVTKSTGRTEIAGMHANWLPELADDLYYDFFSAVTSFENFGTVGVSITFMQYGNILRTNEQGDTTGNFEANELALAFSYGTSLTNKLSGGITAKGIFSRLAEQGAGQEKGSGSATAFAIDFGLLYKMNPRLNLGMAITNLGTNLSYIDADQSDPLPRNLSMGFAYKLLRSQYNQVLLTGEVNKQLVGLNDGFSTELGEIVYNIGAEFMYSDLFAIRGGYIYDTEGDVKTLTVGAGIHPIDIIKFDFAFFPTDASVALANTLRISVSILP